jgi:hypothetical protein
LFFARAKIEGSRVPERCQKHPGIQISAGAFSCFVALATYLFFPRLFVKSAGKSRPTHL